MYMAMYRKPDNGAESHNTAYGQSGITMRLRIVKSTRNKGEQEDYEENLPHGTKVLK